MGYRDRGLLSDSFHDPHNEGVCSFVSKDHSCQGIAFAVTGPLYKNARVACGTQGWKKTQIGHGITVDLIYSVLLGLPHSASLSVFSTPCT